MIIKSKKIFLADGSCYENCELKISLDNLADFASINDGKQAYLVNVGYIEVFDLQDSELEDDEKAPLADDSPNFITSVINRFKKFFP